MMYTSGTTAKPKGCPLTHEAIVRTGDAINARFSLDRRGRLVGSAAAVPPELDPAAARPRSGPARRFVTMVDFEVEAAVKQIVEERVTYMFGTFPTLNQELLGHAGFRSADTSSLRFINQVAPPDMQRALQEALPHARQVSAYGCTELGGIIAQNDPAETPDAARDDVRDAVPGGRGAHRRSRQRARPPGRRAGGDRRPRLRDVRGLPQRPGAHRRGGRARRLVPHGRHRQRRRRRPHRLPRAHEGHAQGRRRERRRARDRVVPLAGIRPCGSPRS